MKINLRYLFITLFALLTQIGFAQEETALPEKPAPPAFDFDFDFRHFPEMSEQDEKELLKNLSVELQNDLKIIKKNNIERYNDFLRESQYKNMKIPLIAKNEKAMLEREKKIFEVEIKTEALAAKYEGADQTEKEKIKSQLRQELNKLFVEKEERRKQEVESLQKELIELKKSLEARQKNKNQIIERRLQELLEEDQYLDWD